MLGAISASPVMALVAMSGIEPETKGYEPNELPLLRTSQCYFFIFNIFQFLFFIIVQLSMTIRTQHHEFLNFFHYFILAI